MTSPAHRAAMRQVVEEEKALIDHRQRCGNDHYVMDDCNIYICDKCGEEAPLELYAALDRTLERAR